MEKELSEQDQINLEKARIESAKYNEILENIRKKNEVIPGYLLEPARYSDEPFDEYKIRQKLSKKYVKYISKGVIFFESKKIEPKIEETDKLDKDGAPIKKVTIHTTTRTYVDPMRHNIEYRKANKNKLNGYSANKELPKELNKEDDNNR